MERRIRSPFFIGQEMERRIRICYDYRGLNSVTIKNQYFLLLIREILNQIFRAKYYTKLIVAGLVSTVPALKLYALPALKLYTLQALKLYALPALELYALQALKLYALPALKLYALSALRLYALSDLKLYDLQALKLYALQALKLYALQLSSSQSTYS
jgi:hypothetical protein